MNQPDRRGGSTKPALAAVMFLVACGGGGDAAVTPDTPPDTPPVPSFTPGCTDVPQAGADPFSSPADFGPIAPGTLAGWDPDGRWFLTGTRVGGVSSFHLERRGDEVIVDRDTDNPGTIDDDAVFQRVVIASTETTFVVAKRVANRAADGSLQADRAVCAGTSCRVCTARLVRAEHNAGEGEHDHLPLVGELYGASWDPGYTFNVRVAGTLAYLIREDGLHVIETADPANPVELGHYARGGDGYSNDVKLVEAGDRRYAIIADIPVDVVDVTDPAAPQLVANIPEEAHTLFVETRDGKTLAYFGNYDASCPVWDVTDPTKPQRLGRYRSSGSMVHDLSIEDGIAYLNAWDAGLVVVDFTDPTQPRHVATWDDTPADSSHSNWTTTIGGRHVAIHGEEAYGAHLQVVDLDPDSATYMQPIGSYRTRDWVSIHNIMAFGSKAYFTYYQDGVRVLDLSDPTQPRLVGYHNTWDPQAATTNEAFFAGAVGLDVDLARRLVFVADDRGLLILRDETP